MNRKIILITPFLFFKRGRGARLSTLKTLQREEHASSHSLLKGRVLVGVLEALVTLVVLVACPVENNRGSGPVPGPGGGTGQPYLCANGTPAPMPPLMPQLMV